MGRRRPVVRTEPCPRELDQKHDRPSAGRALTGAFARDIIRPSGAHILPLPKKANGRSPLLAVSNGVAVYLLYNGIMGDKTVNGGNVLTGPVLKKLPPHDGPRVIYGEGCRLGRARLRRENIVFKQIPYEIKIA